MSSALFFAQNKRDIVPNGSIFKLRIFHRVKGVVLDSTQGYVLKTTRGTEKHFTKNSVKWQLGPDQITLYNNGKYFRKSGYQFNLDYGVSDGFFGTNFSLERRLNKLDVSAGFGIQANILYFRSATFEHELILSTSPVFIGGRYYVGNKPTKLFVGGKVGLGINYKTRNVESASNGLYTNASAGVLFGSRLPLKQYVSVTYNNVHSKGEAINRSNTGLGNIGFDVWFSSIGIGYGMILGR